MLNLACAGVVPPPGKCARSRGKLGCARKVSPLRLPLVLNIKVKLLSAFVSFPSFIKIGTLYRFLLLLASFAYQPGLLDQALGYDWLDLPDQPRVTHCIRRDFTAELYEAKPNLCT